MKQRLTKEDVLSLSKEKQDALRELWEPKDEDLFIYAYRHTENQEFPTNIITSYNKNLNQYYSDTNKRWWYKNDMLPLLSIGDIIEMLENINVYWEDKLFFGYPSFNKNIMENVIVIEKSYDGELIDALFLALKEVL